jgi:hypothetical protein
MQNVVKGTQLRFTYTNWRGETNIRRATVWRIFYGSTEYHPDPQWLMEGVDLDKNAVRVYAMRDMRDVEVIES